MSFHAAYKESTAICSSTVSSSTGSAKRSSNHCGMGVLSALAHRVAGMPSTAMALA